MSADAKTYFAPLPLRAIGDSRLSALDFRVLGCLCAHDRMSKVTGKGQGAWASNETLSREVGCHYARLSSSITKLGKLGYVEREQHPLNKRLRVYRVLYNRGWDTSPNGKQSSSSSVNSSTRKQKVVEPASSPAMHPETLCQPAKIGPEHFADGLDFIQQEQSDDCLNIFRVSDERNFAEATEEYSPEGARFVVPGFPTREPCNNIGGQLAILERALKAGENIDCVAWEEWLAEAIEDDDRLIRNWAFRLSEELADHVNDDECVELELKEEDDEDWF